MNTKFREQKKQINMRRGGPSRVIREIQSKTIMKCHFASRW